jgi:hypothetical protein
MAAFLQDLGDVTKDPIILYTMTEAQKRNEEKLNRFRMRLDDIRKEEEANRRVVKIIPFKDIINPGFALQNPFIQEIGSIRKNENIVMQVKKKKNIISLPSVKSSEPCPEGYVRNPKTGKCVKERKKKKINQDEDLIAILRRIVID